jgi:hypothetical protein
MLREIDKRKLCRMYFVILFILRFRICVSDMGDKTTKTVYVLDNDGKAARLSEQHEVLKDAMGGLVFAPITSRVLDCAFRLWNSSWYVCGPPRGARSGCNRS